MPQEMVFGWFGFFLPGFLRIFSQPESSKVLKIPYPDNEMLCEDVKMTPSILPSD